MKKILFVLTLGLALVLTSCGDQHKAQSLVKDFLNENLENEDCSFKRFSQLTPTAMIDFNRVKSMRQEMNQLPYMKKNIDYYDGNNQIKSGFRFIGSLIESWYPTAQNDTQTQAQS